MPIARTPTPARARPAVCAGCSGVRRIELKSRTGKRR
jgi:hypothetical protein